MKESPGADVATRMADKLVEITKEQGFCTERDIRAAGFTQEEINRHGTLAQSLADMMMNPVNDLSLNPKENNDA